MTLSTPPAAIRLGTSIRHMPSVNPSYRPNPY